MQATDSLSSDHRLIERFIAALEAGADRLQGGRAVRPGFFLDATRFIREFADGFHHRKEEGVLFETMAEHGMPKEGGPIAMMLFEHERGRAYTAAMHAAAERLVAGDAAASPEVAANASGYVALLRQHMFKEDNILFPMAGRVIPPDQHDEVMTRFEQIERGGPGAREDYVALAERLEREVA